MKTRFSDILKVKKQKLSEIERELLDVQNRKKRLESKIVAVDDEVASFKQPQSGDFTLMQLARQSFLQLIHQKELLNQKLDTRIKQIEGLTSLYTEANMEYEKIAYLHAAEIKKALNKLEQEENKAMDEIANILHVNKKEKIES